MSERYSLREMISSGPEAGHPVLSRHDRLSAAIDALIERRHVSPFLGLLTYIYDEVAGERMATSLFIGLGNWVPLFDDDDYQQIDTDT